MIGMLFGGAFGKAFVVASTIVALTAFPAAVDMSSSENSSGASTSPNEYGTALCSPDALCAKEQQCQKLGGDWTSNDCLVTTEPLDKNQPAPSPAGITVVNGPDPITCPIGTINIPGTTVCREEFGPPPAPTPPIIIAMAAPQGAAIDENRDPCRRFGAMACQPAGFVESN